MQISGTGHWFLEGWISDHAVDFLVDPGSALTGHTDAVEHKIDTGISQPVQCAPRRMPPPPPQKIKWEEVCVEMLVGGQIEPSESLWSAPVVLVTKEPGSVWTTENLIW